MGFRLLLELNIFPDHPCMVYLPKVNIPYMDCMGLLMVQKSDNHQLIDMVDYAIIYRVWDTSKVVVWDF